MARDRVKPAAENAEIPMTPMIDVVFQLLIYFIVTMKPVDVVAHLDVFRPAPQPSQEENQTPPNLVRIVIFPDGFTINDRPVTIPEMEKLLGKLASLDKNQTILITCGSESPHSSLVQILDLCSKSELRNLSVLSAN